MQLCSLALFETATARASWWNHSPQLWHLAVKNLALALSLRTPFSDPGRILNMSCTCVRAWAAAISSALRQPVTLIDEWSGPVVIAAPPPAATPLFVGRIVSGFMRLVIMSLSCVVWFGPSSHRLLFRECFLSHLPGCHFYINIHLQGWKQLKRLNIMLFSTNG